MNERKYIVITGGAKGVGMVYASHLAKDPGNIIIVTGRSKTPPDSIIHRLNSTFHYRSLDVSIESQIIPFFSEITDSFGRIDVLINNAGIWGPVGKFNTNDLSEWFDTIKVNLTGVVSCTHAAMQYMVPQKSGIIINMASNAGAHRWPNCSAYSVSKAAIIKLTENLAIESKKDNISHYAFHPGLIHSTGMAMALTDNPPEEYCAVKSALDWILKEKDLGNTVSAEDSIPHIEKLCSGHYKQLSGLYLNVKDNLDEILDNIRNVRRHNSYQLRVTS